MNIYSENIVFREGKAKVIVLKYPKKPLGNNLNR